MQPKRYSDAKAADYDITEFPAAKKYRIHVLYGQMNIYEWDGRSGTDGWFLIHTAHVWDLADILNTWAHKQQVNIEVTISPTATPIDVRRV